MVKGEYTMKECFVVVYRSYAAGVDATAFYSEQEAEESVKTEVDQTITELTEQGYGESIETIDDTFGHQEVFVSNSDIYYEWDIISTVLR